MVWQKRCYFRALRMQHLSLDPTGLMQAGLCATLVLAAAGHIGCGGKARPAKIGAANAVLGECVDPESAGVLSNRPSLKQANRDINGDARDEVVLADEVLCRGGNCNWNLFARQDGCERYIGTIAAASIEVLGTTSDAGFSDLRGWWKLRGGDRQLVQNYRFRNGGYQLVDVLICRQKGDDRLLCAHEEQDTD